MIDFSVHNFCFYIRGLGQDDSEHINIFEIVHPKEGVWFREQILAAFKQSGFAKQSDGHKLLPCELGTYVNASAETIKCTECPAGKFIRSL